MIDLIIGGAGGLILASLVSGMLFWYRNSIKLEQQSKNYQKVLDEFKSDCGSCKKNINDKMDAFNEKLNKTESKVITQESKYDSLFVILNNISAKISVLEADIKELIKVGHNG